MSDYAPQYTTKERIQLLLKHLTWVLPLLLATQYGFLPWFESYANDAHCYQYGPLSGVHLVFYGIFIGLPLLTAIVLFCIEGPRSMKVIQLGQNPLPQEKVLRPTKYKYGARAKIGPYLLFLLILACLGMSIRGIFWANDIIYSVEEPVSLPACSGTRSQK